MRFSFYFLFAMCLYSSISLAQFKKQTIQLGEKVLRVELAETLQQQALGLMFREKFDGIDGMLFVFKSEEPRSFWMKNTLMDLSIAYFDRKKKIIDIQEMKSGRAVSDERFPTYPSKGPAMYALEMPQGWFQKNNVKLGTPFKFQK